MTEEQIIQELGIIYDQLHILQSEAFKLATETKLNYLKHFENYIAHAKIYIESAIGTIK